jgi:outer membrane protein assembly factor BamB
MQSTRVLRRWLSLLATGSVFALVLGIVACRNARVEVKPEGGSEGGPAAAGAPSWPLFGGSINRNFVNLNEKNLPTEWALKKGKEKNVKWSAQLGSKAYGGPILSGDKIFIGTNNEVPRDPAITGDKGVMMCFRQSDGEFLWQIVHDKLVKGRVWDWPKEGICSSPMVEGNRLYYVSNRCEVVCADTEGLANGNQGITDEKYKGKKDGDIIWSLDMIGKLNVFPHNLSTSSPMIVGDILYVVTSNGVDKDHITIPSPKAPSFLALNKKTGEVLWQNNFSSAHVLHGQWSNPVYTETGGVPQVIFPGGDGWLYSFNPKDGSLVWKFDCNPKKAVWKLGGGGTRNNIVATPVVWEDKVYVGVGQDPEHGKGVGHLWCVDIAKAMKAKDKDGSPRDDNFDPKAPVNKGSALVWHYGGEDPKGEFREYKFGRTLCTCAVHDGLCYTADLDGFVYCFDAHTGQKYWEHDMGIDTWCSPYWVDGHVYIGNEYGEVLVFEHGKEKKLVSTIEGPGSASMVRVGLTACDGVLYQMTENPCKLFALNAKK